MYLLIGSLTIFHLLFWGGALLLVHTYIFYPLLLKFLARNSLVNTLKYNSKDDPSDLPTISILMAAHNEEAVIDQKIQSLLAQDYPIDKISIYIGSDNSTDTTNAIIDSYTQLHKHIHLYPFSTRQGKPCIINQLVQKAVLQRPVEQDHLFLMTDASVMLNTDVIFKLAAHFKNPEIGLVDTHMIYTGSQASGISVSEQNYLSGEVQLKSNESKLWGTMIGPFGGCFMMRSQLYFPVPKNFLVDDFFLAMKVLQRGYKVINELSAKCFESVSHEISEEFKRKKRISTGNFQNLNHFKGLLNPFKQLGFALWSHKVLRWLGPFFIIIMLVSTWVISSSSTFFIASSILLTVVVFGIPLMDKLLSVVGINISILRNIRYFFAMNLALLIGFFKYLKGVKSSVWQPTKRT